MGNLLVCLLIWEDLAEDLLRLLMVSDSLLDPSEEMMLPAEAKEALESLDSISAISFSGMASDSLLEDMSEDQRLVIEALESMDLWPIISYLREEVE